MSNVINPILRGFNPDPSILRVGEDYYIATSTFEWYPGVQIFHSRDLQNWSLVGRPLDREALLDMRGVPDSCGVWAPCLTHADGKFWLCYTIVRRFDGDYKDTHNFLTTSDSIEGGWSDPIYLNSSGFDPSLFHAEDGRKYVTNMIWDNRPDRTYFGGIVLQEYSTDQQKLVGERKNIFPGSSLGYTEGPHIYKIRDWYYLMTAEGGTGYDHAVTIARSKRLDGPYEIDPKGAVITHKNKSYSIFQRLGHGSLVDTPSGDWFIAHLCSRPFSSDMRFSGMGRESVLQQVEYTSDGWLRLVESELCLDPDYSVDKRYSFTSKNLHPDFQWLRTPLHKRIFDVDPAKGVLTLYGREAIGSHFEQALVARRQDTAEFVVETKVKANPDCFQQLAGLVVYYNAHKFHYLYTSGDESGEQVIGIMSCEGNESLSATYPMISSPLIVPKATEWIGMKAELREDRLEFSVNFDDGDYQRVGPSLNALILSDEAGKGEGANFTGTFVGMAAQDVSGRAMRADFSHFSYTGSDIALAARYGHGGLSKLVTVAE